MDAGMLRSLAAAMMPAIRVWVAAGRRPLPTVRFCPDETPVRAGAENALLPSPDVLSACADPVREVADRLRQTAPEAAIGPEGLMWPGAGRFVITGSSGGNRRLEGKVAVVTGAAQGFGLGIAEELAAHGAHVVLADIREDAASAAADAVNRREGLGRAIAIAVDVSSESSVRAMVEQTLLAFGGLDLCVSNAGILRAGGLEEMTLQDFQKVTEVNYTGFFLCAKYASVPMKTAAALDPGYWADVIQVNSKSGLQGSNRNFAYAGGKFGGIGLVQSFALELAPHRIKVNAVCPGNYLDGPLWSDPDNGLFVQYLHAGKVPGAKTPAEVRAAYESKVPLGRGCLPADVVKGILYLVDQEYETGQALPVTGGQVMLK